MKPPIPEDKISSRIVAAAAEHFIQDGFEAASTAAIAKTARTSKREIYSRFANKDAMFEEVMGHLCSLVGDDELIEPTTLSEGMQQIAHLVLARTLQEQTQGVLVSAIGASNKFPELTQIFWREGPGQAAKAVSRLLQSSLAREAGFNTDTPQNVAKEYILKCIAPFVLARIFDEKSKPTKKNISDHIKATTDHFMDAYCN